MKPSEARFIGDPVDYVVFKGLDDKNITEVVFVEVKTGRSQLNNNELALKNIVDQQKVKFVTMRIPSDVTSHETSNESKV